MAETTADVRRDIELTRERMSQTIAQLEDKLNVMQVVRDHPWPAIGAAAAAGFLLSGTHADVKAASAVGGTVAVTKSTGSRLGPMLDDLLGRVLLGVQDALQQKADELVGDLRQALGTPEQGAQSQSGGYSESRSTTAHNERRSAADPRYAYEGGGSGEGRDMHGAAGGAVMGVPPRDVPDAATAGRGDRWSPGAPAAGQSGTAYENAHRDGPERRDRGPLGTAMGGQPPRGD